MKLVRWRIAEEIKKRKGGEILKLTDPWQIRAALGAKLIEETFEVVQELDKKDPNKASLTEEIGDLLSVIDAIRDHYKLTERDIFEAYDKKNKKKGDFSRFTFCVNKGTK